LPNSTATPFAEPKNHEAKTLTGYYLILAAAITVVTLIVIVTISIIKRINLISAEKTLAQNRDI
jgi:hypothetical protein